ncbi:MAG: hypothetical protein IIZ04_03400, partial [Aeriscardovia sp.]|nr:hypothetical protein [Aeriscardovia sp.]
SLYGQGSNKPGSWFENGTGGSSYPYAYYGIGPSYEGTGTDSDSTLAMSVSGTATNFLEYVLGPQSNSNQSNGGIYLTAFYNTAPDSASYSSSGTSALVNISPSQGGGAYGTGIYVQFQSLGQDPTNVNPTSGVTLSTSSPSSDGLYFEAVSQSGEPLKSVRMELLPKSIYYWSAWDTTPIAPAKNSAPSTADGHQTWPYWGGTYWAGYYNPVSFTAQSLTSQPGWFDFSGVGAGTYDVVILGGTTESGQEVSYGSYYQEPTFQIDADHGYTSPETISAVHDPCGFVDPSQDEVVVGAANPSSSITQGAASPKSGTSDPYTATVGSKNPFTYQAEAYMPFDLSGKKNNSGASSSSAPLAFTLSLPEGETLNQGSVEVNGKSLKSLGITPSSSSSSGISFALSPKDISSIGSQGGTIDVTFTAYLDPSFTSPGTPKYEFAYKAYGAANSGNSEEDLSAVSTNGPAGQDYSKVSLDPASSPSSETGLWFKDLQADGAESTGAKFEVQNSSGQYLNGDPSNFSGWTWSSTPQQFSASSLGTGTFAFGGLAD